MARQKKPPYYQYKWRIYADHNVEASCVRILRANKIDVLYVNERPKLKRQRDDRRFHTREARKLGRYLLTRDEDFWFDRQIPLHESPGVILLKIPDPVDAARAVVVLRIIVRFAGKSFEGPYYLDEMKVKLSQEGIRIHYLDDDTQKKKSVFGPWEDWY